MNYTEYNFDYIKFELIATSSIDKNTSLDILN